jgi:hypothetical protein
MLIEDSKDLSCPIIQFLGEEKNFPNIQAMSKGTGGLMGSVSRATGKQI